MSKITLTPAEYSTLQIHRMLCERHGTDYAETVLGAETTAEVARIQAVIAIGAKPTRRDKPMRTDLLTELLAPKPPAEPEKVQEPLTRYYCDAYIASGAVISETDHDGSDLPGWRADEYWPAAWA